MRPRRVQVVHGGRVDLVPAGDRVAPHEGGAAHVGDRAHRLARRQPMRDLDDRALGIAVHQQVAFGVHQDGAAHLVLPVVVMGDPPQRAFDAAHDQRHVAIGLAAALGIHQRAAIGTPAADAARGVGIVAADLAVGGVAVDHRIHVAGRHAEEQVRPSERAPRFDALPVGLGDDADAKALGLQRPPDERHAEARVVDIGIAGDDDDVAAVPAQRVHLGAAHRQERRAAEALGPEWTVAGQGPGRSIGVGHGAAGRLVGTCRRKVGLVGGSGRGNGVHHLIMGIAARAQPHMISRAAALPLCRWRGAPFTLSLRERAGVRVRANQPSPPAPLPLRGRGGNFTLSLRERAGVRDRPQAQEDRAGLRPPRWRPRRWRPRAAASGPRPGTCTSPAPRTA